MPYVTIRVSSPTREIIYEKDYSLDVVFGPFVKLKVSHLVGLGMLKEGDEYWADITPGFEERDKFDDVLWELPHEPVVKSGQGWLVLRTNGMTQAEPMKYFTFELHPVRADANWYRKSFPMEELDYRTKQEKATLIQLGAISADEEVSVEYLPASGDVMREREVLHMPEELASLGSGLVVEAMDDQAGFHEKTMPVCNCGHGGQDRGKTLEIFFRTSDFTRLRQYIAAHATRTLESGGILIGEVYRHPGGGQLYIEVEDFIPAENTQANAVSLRFTHETWQKLIDRKRERFADQKHVVGWYHTHPPIPVTIRGRSLQTVGYFSRDDKNVQTQFFREKWQIGVVMDGGSDEFAVFRWQETEIVESDSHFFEPGTSSLPAKDSSGV